VDPRRVPSSDSERGDPGFTAQIDDLNDIQAAQDGQVRVDGISRFVGPEQDAGSYDWPRAGVISAELAGVGQACETEVTAADHWSPSGARRSGPLSRRRSVLSVTVGRLR
jgi:hypothetical protein